MLMWNSKNQHSQDYRRKLLIAASQLKSLNWENFSWKNKQKKSSVLITHSQIQTDDYPNEKSINLNWFVPYLLFLFSLSFPPYCWGQMNIDSCSCVSCFSVSCWTLWRKRENQMRKKEKKQQRNMSTDFNLLSDFRFFLLIFPWNL